MSCPLEQDGKKDFSSVPFWNQITYFAANTCTCYKNSPYRGDESSQVVTWLMYTSLALTLPSLCLIFWHKELQLHPQKILAIFLLVD